MNKKILFFSVIVAISAISISTAMNVMTEPQIEPTLIQTVGVSMEDLSLDMLGNAADYAIVGKVVSITPVVYTDADRAAEKKENTNSEIIILDKEILSDVTIQVEEDLFGKYNEKFITVRIPGGEISGQKTIHEASPEFKVGERAIVFVGNGQSYSISSDNYTVLGLEQGTIRLDDDAVQSKFSDENTTELTIKNQIKSLR